MNLQAKPQICKKILLLSAYDSASHRAWRERLEQLLPEYQWTQLVLPARHFNWKIRGNSLLWAFKERETLEADYDLLIATSMVDLSSLRGFVPALSKLPSIVYFHENQFLYPLNQQRRDNIEPQLVPLYSALCSDAIVFNSQFNRQSFLQGARSLLKRLPDKFPAAVMDKLEKSEVIGVPLQQASHTLKPVTDKTDTQTNTLELVWNHRWEYDKGPALLLEVINLIVSQALPVRCHIVGERFRQRADEFEQIDTLLRKHEAQLGFERAAFGFIDNKAAYFELLTSCDVVLSTALHDFQGLAIQEACIQACTPLAPNDLVYGEYLPEQFLYARSEDHAVTASAIVAKLSHCLTEKKRGNKLEKVKLKEFQPKQLHQRYLALFNTLSK